MLSRDYIYILFEILEERGFSPINICLETDFDVSSSEMVSVQQLHTLIRYIEDVLGIPHCGYLIGLKATTASHGLLGYAAKSSRNVLEGIKLDEQYVASRISGIGFSLSTESDTAILDVFLDDAWLKEEKFIFELIVGAMYSFYLEVLPQKVSDICIMARYPRPEHWSSFGNLTDMVWHFGQKHDAISFPAKKLETELPHADLALKSLLLEQLKHKLKELSTAKPLNEQVANILSKNLMDLPSIHQVAQSLGLHERTLKRRLHKLNTSYRDIVIHLRVSRAMQLLRETDQKIEDVAIAVGYTSTTTFNRLFKKWTGATPSSVRRLTQE